MNKKLSLIMLLPVFSLGAYCESGNCPVGNTRSGYYYLEENTGPNRGYYGERRGYYGPSRGYRNGMRQRARSFNSNPQLMQRIRTELAGGGSLRAYPNVQVVMIEEGVVTLRGAAPTARDVNEIQRRIRNMPGVRDVIIEIDIREDRAMDQSYRRDSRGYSRNGYQNRPMMSENVNDQSLRENIQAKLTDTWFAKSYPNVQVEVANGVVTLRGSVQTVEDIEEVEERVWDVSGVQDVRVELNVQNQSRSYRDQSNRSRSETLGNRYQSSSMMKENLSDKPLKEKVQSQLISYPDVEVMVVEGVVTLEGTVSNERDIDEIVKRVHSLPGVKDVEIEIDVEDSTY